MSLKKYHEKRNFNVTQEPIGRKPKKTNETSQTKKKKSYLYLIQKHAASHLHYDFRLEMHGTLKSWAVPKGPSLDPSVKRLAVEVEDHPIEYGSFEGTIPKNEYGGGTVMLWDTGTWQSENDAYAAYKKGALTFKLNGKKLKGIWKLVKMKMKADNRNNWLLFKVEDEFASTKDDILETAPLSVTTNRDLAEIAENKRPKKPTKPLKEKKNHIKNDLSRLKIKKSSIPNKLTPQLAFLVESVPEGDEWYHEIKLDGYRLICIIKNRRVRFISRNGKDWTNKVPHLVKEIQKMKLDNSILDGELVALDKSGISKFQLLQNSLGEPSETGAKSSLKYFVFDLPYYNGFDLTKETLQNRKNILKGIFENFKNQNQSILYLDHIQGKGLPFYKAACQKKLEGTISKKSDSPYLEKRSRNWLKNKCSNRQEFVIGGYTEPQGSRKYFGALLLGYYDAQHRLVYCGNVGTGFNEQTLKELFKIFSKLKQKTSPFYNFNKNHKTTWIKPTLVCEVEFTEMTSVGSLRHPAFLGLRIDKSAKNVKAEEKIITASVKTGSKNSKNKTVKNKKIQANKNPVSDINFTHIDSVVKSLNVTKNDLIKYYEKVSEWILPHLLNRPLVLVRCPRSEQNGCFFQKRMDKAFLKNGYVSTIRDPKDGIPYGSIKDVNGLLTFIQFNVVEIHPWGSSKSQLEKPDRITFDLDPDPELPWKAVIQTAFYIRQKLAKLKLDCYVKTSGGKGLHIVLPIMPEKNWNDVKTFTKEFVDSMISEHPNLFVGTAVKAKRKGKIFVDYLRNARGATAVAPYSTKAKPNAPVSTPITWAELSKIKSGDAFNISNISKRLNNIKKDPWEGFFKLKQKLPNQ